MIFSDRVQLIGYFASAVNLVSPNPCVGPSPKLKISYYQHAQMSSYQLQKQ